MGGLLSKNATAAATTAADDLQRFTQSTKLLPNELALLQQGPSPIGTLTWIEGDVKEAEKDLRQRLGWLCRANPWLTGRITPDGYLRYPETVQDDLMEPLFVRLDTVDDVIHHNETDFTKLAALLSQNGALLLPKQDTKQPLLRVCLLPSSLQQQANCKPVFGLVVSMSHVAVDGHSYYQLYNALVNTDTADKMPQLQVQRLAESNALKEDSIGKENLVFMRPGMLVSLLGGLVYDLFMWPFQKSMLKIEKQIALVDGNKMRQFKSAMVDDAQSDDCKFVSTNDVITSWFLTQSRATYGFMAFNLRNRLKGHSPHLGGNYSDLLFYRTPSDTHSSTLVRKSLKHLRRTESLNEEPTFWELASGKSSFVTNWASFASGTIDLKDMRLLAHYPMVDLASNVMPSTMTFCVIFRAKADQLGILFAGAAYRVHGMLEDCPFLLDRAAVQSE